MPLPVLVYCTEGSDRSDMDRFLNARGMYRYDDLPELDEDATRPTLDRPLLRRLITFTNRSGVTLDPPNPRSFDEPMPAHLVVDHLGALGPDLESQVAVVGAFMSGGVEVVAGWQSLRTDWYYEQMRRLDSGAVLHLSAELLEDPSTVGSRESWEHRNPGPLWVLPTTHSPIRSYESARGRIRELVREEDMSVRAAAPRLQVAGYRNREGRVRWYPAAVSDALQDMR